jgi:hypothetical protein
VCQCCSGGYWRRVERFFFLLVALFRRSAEWRVISRSAEGRCNGERSWEAACAWCCDKAAWVVSLRKKGAIWLQHLEEIPIPV